MKQLNWYQIFGESHKIPDGRTVTPTDDIQIWLHCADIWNKTYTTLAEVLADTPTLVMLMSIDNAVDYLVRSTTWAGIALVPTMTSDTTPSGECFASDLVTNPYRAFDKNNSTVWYATTGSVVNQYVGYKFPTSKRIGKVKGTAYINVASTRTYTVKVQGSNDGFSSDIHDLTSAFTYSGTSSDTVNINQAITNIGNYESYRLFCTAVSDSTSTRYGFKELQFYSESLCDSETAMQAIGANNYASNTLLADSTWCSAICNSTYFESVLNVKAPKMTSNTTPSGVCFGYGAYSSNPYYYAFDSDDSTFFATDAAISNANVGYEFPNQVKVYMCKALVKTNMTSESHYTFKVQGSTDRFTSDITDLSEAFNITLANQGSTWVTKLFNTTKSSFRLFSTTQLEASRRMVVNTLQFYGRQDV